MKKLVAILLAVLLVFTLVGCNKNKREIIKLTLSTEDSEAILAAAGITLPDAEETAAAGTKIKWYSWHDPFHNYAEDEIVNTGFWTFTEKYGCDVEWIECTWDQRYDGLANLILAGTSPDSAAGEFPMLAIKGMFQAVDDYIDYDDPLWGGVKDFADTYYRMGDKHYMIITDVSFMRMCAYNRRVMEEWGFDDPAELYYNDEWTWDVFYDMCMEFSDPDEERYALDGWAYPESLVLSTGIEAVVYKAEENKFESRLDDPRLERVSNLLYDLFKNECCYPYWEHGWVLRNNTEGGGMKEGLLLFTISGSFVITGPVEDISNIYGDVTAGEVMFCPLPRDPNGDGVYHMPTEAVGYYIVEGAPNPHGVGLLASCDRFKIIDPTVVSIDRRQLEEVYLWTDEMLEMYDECYRLASEGTRFLQYTGEGALGKELGQVKNDVVFNATGANPVTWAQIKESQVDKLNYYLDAFNKSIQEFIAKESAE